MPIIDHVKIGVKYVSCIDTIVSDQFSSGIVLSQKCYTETDCRGASFAVHSARECCLETDHGLSYQEGESCIVAQCIGNKSFFSRVSYS